MITDCRQWLYSHGIQGLVLLAFFAYVKSIEKLGVLQFVCEHGVKQRSSDSVGSPVLVDKQSYLNRLL